jgi:hypothetical protein
MTQFITISLLICHLATAKHLSCYEKGSKNLRSEEVITKTAIQYTKCSVDQRSCDLTEWDGCKYKMKDGTEVYSGETCPYSLGPIKREH